MREEKRFYVYILASQHYGTLYIGMTSNLIKRMWEHQNGVVDGFSKKYSVKNLVYYEVHDTFETAMTREKQMKAWKRQWKINLIENQNPRWDDLSQNLM
ncbi:MAG: GIY-YIG nuclease family protein [Pseudomonadota bacterium]